MVQTLRFKHAIEARAMQAFAVQTKAIGAVQFQTWVIHMQKSIRACPIQEGLEYLGCLCLGLCLRLCLLLLLLLLAVVAVVVVLLLLLLWCVDLLSSLVVH